MKDSKTTTFTTEAQILTTQVVKKESLASMIPDKADLSGLRAMLPSKKDIEDNGDILFFTANLAVANLINLNGDGVLTDGMIQLSKTIKHKPINVEHSRADGAIGCIISSGFSTFGTNELISEEEASKMEGAFNLVITGAIWKIMAGDVWSIIEESSQKESPHYQAVSCSWEIGFDDWALSNTKEFTAASIIYGEKAKTCAKYFKTEGGKGVDENGIPQYRVVLNPLGLGLGMVTDPAAPVKGIITEESFSEDEMPEVPENESEEPEETVTPEDPEVEDDSEEEKTTVKVEIEIEIEASTLNKSEDNKDSIGENEDSEKNIEKDEKIISTFANAPVINLSNKQPMKFTTLESTLDYLEAQASTIVDVKGMRDFLTKTIQDANNLYVSEQEAKAEVEKKLAESLSNADKAKAQADNLQSELSELKASMAAKEAQETFDKRFGALAEQYDLADEKVSAFVAKSIRDLDEEGFAHWKDNDGLVILASREKKKAAANIEEATEAMKEAKASVDLPNAQELEKKEQSFLSLANEISFKLKK